MAAATAGMNFAVVMESRDYITDIDQLNITEADYVLVLGAGYIDNSTPSNILADRIAQGVEAYEKLDSGKMLMSGDSEYPEMHNETGVMKKYAMSLGVDESDIIEDVYGINTYDSIWRARYVYGAQTLVICTQRFHLYRAVYIARKLGMTVYGIDCTERDYHGQESFLAFREVIAKCKEFVFCLLKMEAKHYQK